MSTFRQRHNEKRLGPAYPAEWLVEMEDADAWIANPKHRWVYDRLLIAETQTYAHAPLGVTPKRFPVIVKQITNLHGMGIGARFVSDPDNLDYAPGMMWADHLEGSHVSTDALVDRGQILWSAQATGVPSDRFGRFDLWALHDAPIEPELTMVNEWCRVHLGDYAGPLNVESIGGQIIEAHLRLSTDWQRAGCYGDYCGSPQAAYGIPLFGKLPQGNDLPGAWIDERQEADRRAFAVVRTIACQAESLQ